MQKLLIVNAKIVNEGRIEEKDVRIAEGRIAEICVGLQATNGEEVIDAAGKYLMPGMIDDQVHFREPGLTHKGDINSESSAAVAGGITSFMEMPNVNPLTINHQALEDKYIRAAQVSRANFAFYLGASNDNLDQIKSLDPKTACGIKVFMGASTGNMLVDDPKVLDGIFSEAPTLVVTHCEDTPMIAKNEQVYKEKYGEDLPFKYHPLIRSAEACYKSSSMAIDLAKKHGTNLHVLHLTTEKEMELFIAGDMKDKKITAEVCIHHLFFNDQDYDRLGSQIKCNPAIKRPEDQQALIQAVLDDRIDVIATDHAPHTWEEKQRSYFGAPAGLPLVQYALLSVLEFYHRGTFPLELIVRKTSHAVADRFQVKDRGYIREGYWADLVLVDLQDHTTVTRDQILSKCGWSPFEGYMFKSRIDTTIVNGQIAYRQGKLEPVIGKRMEFNR
ncbi:dihydroorotase [Oceanospirillum maris]|uniref:dihydroorotase n=1 Tax=Oceanospirillum maris TaxID=64977 RepID=UPI0003F77F10|nr:dihydroorotase [Oceanospirillum maris]